MIWTIVMLIVFFFLIRMLARRGIGPARPRTPIEPAKAEPALPPAEAKPPAVGDGKATVDSLMEDFAAGKISVEEYERLLDQHYKEGQR